MYFRCTESQDTKTICLNDRLVLDGALTVKTISTYCSCFYSKLYTSQFCEGSAFSFLESIEVDNINNIDRDRGGAPFTLLDITDAINCLKHNRSPGVDGLTSEFCRAFVDQLPIIIKSVYWKYRQ